MNPSNESAAPKVLAEPHTSTSTKDHPVQRDHVGGNSMNLDFSAADLVAEKVWHDASIGRLCLLAGGCQNGIPLEQIPDGDFESSTPIGSFSLGQNGAVVVCHHKDGAETWLPVDLWLPDGFTAKAGR